MEPLVSSSSVSLTSRSTESMEVDSPHADTPLKSSSRNTPLRDTNGNSLGPLDPLSPNTEKSIVVTAPATLPADASAIMFDETAIGEEEDDDAVTPYSKRKRMSVNYTQGDTGYDKQNDEHPVKRGKMSSKIRGVLIGVWRDSDQPKDEDKHVIFGFIDIHDRLRTRIYDMNRRDEEVGGNIPTGAGGCWVTFPRIIFEPHLKDLNSIEVKEYVRLRSEVKQEATPEERHEADLKAVLKAKAIAAELEAAGPISKPIVHRPSMTRAPTKDRHSLPRQSLNSTPGFKAVNASTYSPKPSPSNNEGKPNGVLLGYWADSDEPRVEDKHAAYGVLGHNDCFRIKVQKITRDGRYIDGNFPVGAGAMWLHYDKVVFEPQFAAMSRPEIKEYVRIRQRDLETRESEKDRKMNEAKAIRQAKEIVANEGPHNGVERGQASPDAELRHSARSEHRVAARQQADADTIAERARKEKVEARERQNEKARREVAIAEAAIQEAALAELKTNLKKLNKVWVAQQAGSGPSTPSDEVKYHNGIKYERKQNGPFQGKLVSSPQILSIDGEDYVEYRVLTKPSFF